MLTPLLASWVLLVPRGAAGPWDLLPGADVIYRECGIHGEMDPGFSRPPCGPGWGGPRTPEATDTPMGTQSAGTAGKGCLPTHPQVQVTPTVMEGTTVPAPLPRLQGVCGAGKRRGPVAGSCSNPSPHQGAEGSGGRHGLHTAQSSSLYMDCGVGAPSVFPFLSPAQAGLGEDVVRNVPSYPDSTTSTELGPRAEPLSRCPPWTSKPSCQPRPTPGS